MALDVGRGHAVICFLSRFEGRKKGAPGSRILQDLAIGNVEDLPGRDLFGFGAVTPTPGRPPRACGGWTQVNWNTYVTWYED